LSAEGYPLSFRIPRNLTSYVLLILLCLVAVTPAQLTDSSLNVSLVGSIELEAPQGGNSGPSTTDLYVAGNYAYMGSNSDVLYIIDISQPEAMRQVAEVEMPGPALDVKVSGDLAVVGVQGGRQASMGLVVVDISDPTEPRILSQFSHPTWFGVHNLFLYEERAYLAHAANRGLTVVDLADPANPEVSGFWTNERSGFSNVIHDVFVRDGLAFLSDIVEGRGGLVVLDLAAPDEPVTLSSLPLAEGAHNAWQDGRYVYVNQEFGGWSQALHIVDIADRRNPVEVGTFRIEPDRFSQTLGPHNTWVEDGLLYWAYYEGGLRVLDLRNPLRPVEIGYSTTGLAWGVQPHTDGLVYLADSRQSALLALRFEPPAFAIADASLFGGQSTALVVNASVVPFAQGVQGRIDRVYAQFLDLQGTSTGEWDLLDDGSDADGTAGDGEYTGAIHLPPDLPSGLYHIKVQVEDGRGRIYPFNKLDYAVFPPGDRVIFDQGLAADVQVEGRGGFKQVEFTSEGPVFQGGAAAAFEVAPDNVVGWNIALNFAEPVNLFGYTALRFAFYPGNASGQELNLRIENRNFSMVGRNAPASLAVDLERAEWQLVEFPLDEFPAAALSSIGFSGDLEGAFYLGDMRLVAPFNPNTAVVEEYAPVHPSAFSLQPNFPNPFNSSTAIRFVLPYAADVHLSLFNLAGQQVATLVEGRRGAGHYTLHWDGRDDGGRVLASGAYFYRLRAGAQAETRKLLLLR